MDNILVLMVISMAVGLLGALTGLGGASIIVPLLVLAGVPVKEAIASAMVTIIATSSGSAASYVRQHLTNVRIAMFLEIFTISGAIVGATITTFIKPIFLYFFFALFLSTAFLRPRHLVKYYEGLQQDRISRWLKLEGQYYDEATHKTVSYKVNNALPGGLGMFVAGLAAGMLGIGAGSFKVTVQENLMKIPPKVASTTSNFIIGMTALAGVSVYLFSGLLNLTLMAPMAIGVTLGSLIGGRILNRINDRYLRIMFYIVVLYVMIQMLYKGFSLLGSL